MPHHRDGRMSWTQEGRHWVREPDGAEGRRWIREQLICPAERAETGFVNSASTRPRSRHKAKLNRLVHLRALDLASSFICDLVLHLGAWPTLQSEPR